MSNLPESLWDDQFIKEMMEKFAKEERPMQPFMDTSSSSTFSRWHSSKRIYLTETAKKVIEDKEKPKEKPQFFDPKELDIDD